jgi:hypothetical protein
MEKQPYRPHRSLFFPIVLIGVGLIWLLGNLGAIAAFDLPVLLRLWPVLLVFIGIDILIGRRSPLVGAVLGGLAIVVVVGFLVGGRELGLSPDVKVNTQRFTAPIGTATSANVVIAFSDSPATIIALADSDKLIQADLTYVGTVNFRVTGTLHKVVRLARNEADFLLFSPLYWDPNLSWGIALTPSIPLSLTLDGGSGESRVDLSGLQLASLKASMGSGASAFTAPAGGPVERIQVSGGAGSMDWAIPSGAAFEMDLSGGSGAVNIRLPASPNVLLEIREKDAGEVSFPSGWVPAPLAKGDAAAWQSPGYSSASRAIHIVITEIGSGSIHIG